MAGFVLLSLSEIPFNDSVRSAPHHAVFASLPLVALGWRRQYPITVALVVLASNLVANPNHEFTTVLTLVLCSYTVGVETAPPRSYVGLAVTLGPFLIAMALDDGALLPSDVAAAAVFMVGPWLVGYTTRMRTEKAVRAVTEAERRLHEQEIRAHEAASNERNRIARELHDIVSHAISVVTIQTQAVRRRLGPDHAEEAADLAMVETTALRLRPRCAGCSGCCAPTGSPRRWRPNPGSASCPAWSTPCPGPGPRSCSRCTATRCPSPRGWTSRRTA